MGMDVYGIAPETEKGEYFRNNVWYWRPLWNYCQEVSILARSVKNGHDNSGDGLNGDDAKELAQILFNELANGGTQQYHDEYYKALSELPLEDCSICKGTGIRSDELGVEHGHTTKELSPENQVLYGRTHGWCNGCDGAGQQTNWMANYPFEVENVREFATFLQDCGGFEIC